MTASSETDYLVVGGGVVGMAIAYGLARAGESVRVLDEGDDAFRATRGNFGLVWVQGKGAGNPAYARWTMASARAWPQLAQQLMEETGVDVELSQVGGLSICLDERELAERTAAMEALRQALGGDYPYQVLDHATLRELCPPVGPEVAGAVFGPLDGHVSPLRLLRALVQAFARRGGRLASGAAVRRIEQRGGLFRVRAGEADYAARRIVLAAGLGNRALAPAIGLAMPVKPNRGQVLISERLQPFLRHPSAHVRQTGEGTVQIGDSKEDVGFDDGTTLEQLSRIARRAVRCFPRLAGVNIVRAWGALRVMSPDGFPIYQEAPQCAGAFAVSCHSGITLAAAHAGVLADWMRGAPAPAELASFKEDRFHVQDPAR